jgi:hypothetical protein
VRAWAWWHPLPHSATPALPQFPLKPSCGVPRAGAHLQHNGCDGQQALLQEEATQGARVRLRTQLLPPGLRGAAGKRGGGGLATRPQLGCDAAQGNFWCGWPRMAAERSSRGGQAQAQSGSMRVPLLALHTYLLMTFLATSGVMPASLSAFSYSSTLLCTWHAGRDGVWETSGWLDCTLAPRHDPSARIFHHAWVTRLC